MNWSEAIETVNSRYVPGVVAHYAKKNPDPWQAAHDELERVAGILDPGTVGPVLDRFVQRCSELIAGFQNSGRPNSSMTPVDSMELGDEMLVNAHFSRKFKTCVYCEEKKKDLKIVPVKPGGLDMMLICEACEPRTRA